MNISRDNYEEYFLLYADNELTDSEKAEVLIFVKNNKDLEEEFRAMLLTISRPDTNIQLTDKSFLLKQSEFTFINQKNYEEVFVLYHDNELTPEQKWQTEAFLLQYPTLKEEFDLIGLARLTPDSTIVFPDKKALYRKERSGRILPLFVRLAAAAAFIGFVLWLANLHFKKPTSPVAIAKPVPEKTVSPEIKTPAKRETQLKNKTNISESIAQNSQERAVFRKEKQEKAASQKNSDNAALKNVVTDEQPENVVADNILPGKIDTKISGIDKLKNIPAAEGRLTTVIPIVAPVKNINDSSEVADNTFLANSRSDDNYIFYDVKADNFKKTKVGGFLKKVRRVVERTNPIAQLLSGEGHPVALK
ncbi:MAG TPA: hypothetical protein VG847_11355 [Chitinophagaceae bacterium]|nr:hypothetical protein [Chitinophagaceae bacterium]